MAATHLKLVPEDSEVYLVGQGPETRAQRVQRMQTNARSLAREHAEDLIKQMGAVGQVAAEIAAGGEAYPAGVREACRRLSADMDAQVKAIDSLLNRTP